MRWVGPTSRPLAFLFALRSQPENGTARGLEDSLGYDLISDDPRLSMKDLGHSPSQER